MLRPPSHLLHIGPWAPGVRWKAVPNLGLPATVRYPSRPLLGIPNPTSMNVTLNRDDVSEASVEFMSDRDSAVVIEEMVTDLWWRRHDHSTGITENIGRFNARDVQVKRDGDLIRVQVQWEDYRGVLDDRIIYTAASWPAGTTTVVKVLQDIIPVNSLIDLSVLYSGINLGTIGVPFQVEPGDKISEVIDHLKGISGLFDWSVELVGDALVLALYPGGRGINRGVILVDKGTGYTPIQTWDRRVNTDDYATLVMVKGQTGSQVATLEGELPTGVRDQRVDDSTLQTQALVAARAQQILNERRQRHSSWQIQLMPGVWQGLSHIGLGDPVRVVVQLGEQVLDETLQVEQISIEVPSTGVEDVSLTLGIARPNPDPRAKRSAIGKILKKIDNRAK